MKSTQLKIHNITFFDDHIIILMSFNGSIFEIFYRSLRSISFNHDAASWGTRSISFLDIVKALFTTVVPLSLLLIVLIVPAKTTSTASRKRYDCFYHPNRRVRRTHKEFMAYCSTIQLFMCDISRL